MSERMLSTESTRTRGRVQSAAHMAAQATSLHRRVTTHDFGTYDKPQPYRVLNHPLCPAEDQPPYKARLPKRAILPGLVTL